MEWRASCAGKKESVDHVGKWSSLLAKRVKKVYVFLFQNRRAFRAIIFR